MTQMKIYQVWMTRKKTLLEIHPFLPQDQRKSKQAKKKHRAHQGIYLETMMTCLVLVLQKCSHNVQLKLHSAIDMSRQLFWLPVI